MDNMSKIEQEGISGGTPAVGAAPQSAEGQSEGGLSTLGQEMGGGGEGGGIESLAALISMFQSKEALDVDQQVARMAGVEGRLIRRLYKASQARDFTGDKRFRLPGLTNPVILNRLASVQQIVTTSAWPEERRGDVLARAQDPNTGQPVDVIAASNVVTPPLLIRELVINDRKRNPALAGHVVGDVKQIILRPYLPEKLEELAEDISRLPNGQSKEYKLAEEEASRKQINFYMLLAMLTRGLAGSMTPDDRQAMQTVIDELQVGTHDESAAAKIVSMIPAVRGVLVSDKIDGLVGLYQEHLTNPSIFAAVRTFGVGIEMVLYTPTLGPRKVSGLVGMGDFMDEILASQKNIELVQQKFTDAGPRQMLRADIAPGITMRSEGKQGIIIEEGNLIWRTLGKKLGYFDATGQWVSLQDLFSQGYKAEDVVRTNMPDLAVMMPLTRESINKYPMFDMVAAELYPLYMCGREFIRALLLDLMLAPDFSAQAGKEVRKLRRWVYDVWTYLQAKTGLNEIQKAYPYKDIISEKLVPYIIDLVKYRETQNWRQQLKQSVQARGGLWMEGWDSYASLTALQKDVIAKVLTKPTLLASRLPVVEGYVTALALNNFSTTRQQKLDVYKDSLVDEYVRQGGMGLEEVKKRVDEFSGFIDYWNGGGPLRPEFESDKASRSVSQNYTLEQWLKHKITNELYASKSQHVGSLRTKEEMGAALTSLTESEKAVLDFGNVDFSGLAAEMGIPFASTTGLNGLTSLVNNFEWRYLPVDGAFRAIDATSVSGYISDFVALTGETSKFVIGVGAQDFEEKVTQLPTTFENVDTGLIYGISDKYVQLIASTYQFVPYPHQRERALESTKLLLRAITPLQGDQLIPATMRIVPKGSGESTHQEIFIPVKLFNGDDSFTWLMGNAMRGSKTGGKDGMIFLSDFPARFHIQFGDVRNAPFQDMKKAAKECKGPLTIVGMERPGLNTLPWKVLLDEIVAKLQGNELLRTADVAELRRYAEKTFQPSHKYTSETPVEGGMRVAQDGLDLLGGGFKLMSDIISAVSGK